MMSASSKPPPLRKKVPALAIRSLLRAERAKGNRDKTIRIHVVGIHSAAPEPQKPPKPNPVASCNLQERRRITTFNLKQSKELQEPEVHTHRLE